MKNRNNEQYDASKLSVLDKDLEYFAKNHQTKVLVPKSKYYPPPEKLLEEREISWTEGKLAKAIMIKPHQTPLGVKPDTWDFLILVWNKDLPAFEKPFQVVYLLKDAGIDILKNNIDQLLKQSEQKLRVIKPEDLD